jgi:hypothetical protein
MSLRDEEVNHYFYSENRDRSFLSKTGDILPNTLCHILQYFNIQIFRVFARDVVCDR